MSGRATLLELALRLAEPGAQKHAPAALCEALLGLGVAGAAVWLLDPEDDRVLLRAGAVGSLDERAPERLRTGDGGAEAEALRSLALVPAEDGAVWLALRYGERPMGLICVESPDGGGPSADALRAIASMGGAAAYQAGLLERLYRAAREVEVANRRLREADGMKNEFLAVMSHELRTPLNSVLGFTGMLLGDRDHPLPPNHLHSVRAIERCGRQLLHVFEEMLDVTRLEGGSVTLRPEAISLSGVVHNAVAGLRPQAEARQVEVGTDIPETCDAVEADPVRLTQVLTNLVGNAIKFSDPGGPVMVTAEWQPLGPRRGLVEICVQDQGVGIPPDHLERVFEPFHRVEAARRRRTQGAGLGLAIARRLVELHGGRMRALSEEGRGTRVYFTLPVERSEAPGNG